MNWFTSDNHFGHIKVIEYCERPFKDVTEMNLEMIRRWNNVVKPEDTVWHLGDFALSKQYIDWVRQLNGRVHLVAGNHDGCFPKHRKHLKEVDRYLRAGFVEIHLKPVWFHGKFDALLWHLPYKLPFKPEGYELRYWEWRPDDKGSILLHGHRHGKKPREFSRRQIDVGVDAWSYAPVSEDQIATLLDTTEESLDF